MLSPSRCRLVAAMEAVSAVVVKALVDLQISNRLSGISQWTFSFFSRDVALGPGFRQPPSAAMIASACLGPQLPRL